LRGENEDGQHKTPQIDQIFRFEKYGKPPIVAEGTGMRCLKSSTTRSQAQGSGGRSVTAATSNQLTKRE
jgi:hypothetical protein